MKKVISITFRVLSLPFIAGVFAVFLIRVFLANMYRWILYGGESTIYHKKDRPTINNIYSSLQTLISLKQETNE